MIGMRSPSLRCTSSQRMIEAGGQFLGVLMVAKREVPRLPSLSPAECNEEAHVFASDR